MLTVRRRVIVGICSQDMKALLESGSKANGLKDDRLSSVRTASKHTTQLMVLGPPPGGPDGQAEREAVPYLPVHAPINIDLELELGATDDEWVKAHVWDPGAFDDTARKSWLGFDQQPVRPGGGRARVHAFILPPGRYVVGHIDRSSCTCWDTHNCRAARRGRGHEAAAGPLGRVQGV
jgi:hypothetical protein